VGLNYLGNTEATEVDEKACDAVCCEQKKKTIQNIPGCDSDSELGKNSMSRRTFQRERVFRRQTEAHLLDARPDGQESKRRKEPTMIISKEEICPLGISGESVNW